MTARFAPGPWVWSLYRDGDYHFLYQLNEDGAPLTVASAEYEISGYGSAIATRIDISDANARLIAAAPDLLAALIDARRQLEGYELARSGEDYNSPEINAAIAKALAPSTQEGGAS